MTASLVTAHTTSDELAELSTYLHRHFFINTSRRAAQSKLSVTQYTLLGFLQSYGPLNMSRLASLMGHTTPATTGLVDRLCESGLVERSAPERDRRLVLVQITPKGASLLAEMKFDLSGQISEILDRLSPDDREAWLRIYREIQLYCAERHQE